MLGEDVPVEYDWRFADLVAKALTDTALGQRYTADPRAVLAEFGLASPAGRELPALAGLAEIELIIENLDHVRPGEQPHSRVAGHHAGSTICTRDLEYRTASTICTRDLAYRTGPVVCTRDLEYRTAHLADGQAARQR